MNKNIDRYTGSRGLGGYLLCVCFVICGVEIKTPNVFVCKTRGNKC